MSISPNEKMEMASEALIALCIVVQYREWAKVGKLTKEAQEVYDHAAKVVNKIASMHMPSEFSIFR